MTRPPHIRRLLPAVLTAILLACAAGMAPTPTDRFADRPLARQAGQATRGVDSAANNGPSITRVALSLGFVVVMIAGLGYAYRRLFAGESGVKASGSVRLVSRNFLTPRHQVLVMSVGDRLMVIGDSGHGMQPLCSITDPDEIARILGQASGSLADAEEENLRAQAFSASLSHAAEDFGSADSSAGDDRDPRDEVLGGNAFEPARSDVRQLLDRVRALAGEMNTSRSGEGDSSAGRAAGN